MRVLKNRPKKKYTPDAFTKKQLGKTRLKKKVRETVLGKNKSTALRNVKRTARQLEINKQNKLKENVFKNILRTNENISYETLKKHASKLGYGSLKEITSSKNLHILVRDIKKHYSSPQNIAKILSFFSKGNLDVVVKGMNLSGASVENVNSYLFENLLEKKTYLFDTQYVLSTSSFKKIIDLNVLHNKIKFTDFIKIMTRTHKSNAYQIGLPQVDALIKGFNLKTPSELGSLLKYVRSLGDKKIHENYVKHIFKEVPMETVGKALVHSGLTDFNEVQKRLINNFNELEIIKGLKGAGMNSFESLIERFNFHSRKKTSYDGSNFWNLGISQKVSRPTIFESHNLSVHLKQRKSSKIPKLYAEKLIDAFIAEGYSRPEHIAKMMTYDIQRDAHNINFYKEKIILDTLVGLTYAGHLNVSVRPKASAKNFASALKSIGLANPNVVAEAFENIKKKDAFYTKTNFNKAFANSLFQELGVKDKSKLDVATSKLLS